MCVDICVYVCVQGVRRITAVTKDEARAADARAREFESQLMAGDKLEGASTTHPTEEDQQIQ